jgi:hypothetical protein
MMYVPLVRLYCCKVEFVISRSLGPLYSPGWEITIDNIIKIRQDYDISNGVYICTVKTFVIPGGSSAGYS